MSSGMELRKRGKRKDPQTQAAKKQRGRLGDPLNAIDAGSTDCAVSLDVAACAIVVRDNGRGLSEAELRVVGERHATSKLASLAELERGAPATLGFRGEALHCIAAVSHLEIVSCSAASHPAWRRAAINGSMAGAPIAPSA